MRNFNDWLEGFDEESVITFGYIAGIALSVLFGIAVACFVPRNDSTDTKLLMNDTVELIRY